MRWRESAATELRGPVVFVLDHLSVYQTSLVEGVRRVLGAAGVPLVVYANDRSLPELLVKVAANTTVLGLRRCFIVLYESTDANPNAHGLLLLNHTDRSTYVTPDAKPFRLADLLPTDVRDEMAHGSLMLRPLAIETHDLGCVLFDEIDPGELVGELRTDLSRAIDSLHNNERHNNERHNNERHNNERDNNDPRGAYVR